MASQTVTIAEAPSVVLHRVEEVAREHATSEVQRENAGVLLRRENAWVVSFQWNKASNFSTLGQRVRISIEAAERAGTVLAVEARSGQLFDWGQGTRLVTQLISEISDGWPVD